MKNFWRRLGRKSHVDNQSGMASLMVTGILVALLAIIVVGFSLVMNREVNKSVSNQLGQSAYDAALSGINDVASYVKAHPTTSTTGCSDLLGTGKINPNITADGSTKYTCILVDSTPDQVTYPVGANQSQVAKIHTTATMKSLMISWRSDQCSSANDTSQACTSHNQYVSAGNPTCNDTTKLYDETTWSGCQLAPLLRVGIYPVKNNSVSFASAHDKSFFLYPDKAPSQNSAINKFFYSTATSGAIQTVDCGTTNQTGIFTGSAQTNACNVILRFDDASNTYTGNGSYDYYLTLTPIYGGANVYIKANDTSGQTDTFVNTQAQIDVTAQAGSALKRLQATVPLGSSDVQAGSDLFPPYALRSAATICKRLVVPSDPSLPAYTDPASQPYCGLNLPAPQPPGVNALPATNVDNNSATLNATVNPNKLATKYWFVYATGSVPVCGSVPASAKSAGSGSTDVSVSSDISGLTGSSTYNFKICADNAAGPSEDTGSFKTTSPDPLVITGKTISAGPNSTYQNPNYTYQVDGYITGLSSDGKTEKKLTQAEVGQCFFAFDNDPQLYGGVKNANGKFVYNTANTYQHTAPWSSFISPEGAETEYYQGTAYGGLAVTGDAIATTNNGAVQFPCSQSYDFSRSAPGAGVQFAERVTGTFDKKAWNAAGHNIGDPMWYQLCASTTGSTHIICSAPNWICQGTANPFGHTDEAWCGIGGGGGGGGGGTPGLQTVIVDCFKNCTDGNGWDAHIVNNGDNAGFWHCDQFTSPTGSNTSSNYSLSGFTASGGADSNATYIKCYAADGAWGDNLAPGPNFTMNGFYVRAWNQGSATNVTGSYGECGVQAKYPDGSSANNTWYCRNQQLDSNGVYAIRINPDYPNIIGCADGIHRWTVCKDDIFWDVTATNMPVACLLFQSDQSASGGKALLANGSGNYQSPRFGWINVGSPYPFTLTCYDSQSHSQSWPYDGAPY